MCLFLFPDAEVSSFTMQAHCGTLPRHRPKARVNMPWTGTSTTGSQNKSFLSGICYGGNLTNMGSKNDFLILPMKLMAFLYLGEKQYFLTCTIDRFPLHVCTRDKYISHLTARGSEQWCFLIRLTGCVQTSA